MAGETEGLTKLGSQGTKYDYKSPSADMLECFPNPHPGRDFLVQHTFDEFTSLCPKTGQPDFANITVTFVPDQNLVETKSLKLYYFAFRNEGAFMERIVNKIKDDLVNAMGGVKWIRVIGIFAPRGGIQTEVESEEGDVRYSAMVSSSK